MPTPLITLAPASALAILLVACGPGREDPQYRAAGDTPRASPGAVVSPAQDAPPDSTTGVARSSGRPGVAGDTISRSSNISAPPGKSPDPKRP